MPSLRSRFIVGFMILLAVSAVPALRAAPSIAQYQINVSTNSPTPLGTATRFTLIAPDPAFKYYWDFGDGTTDLAEGTSVTHTFLTPGTFFVGLEPYLRDTGGEGGLYVVVVTVTDNKTIYLPVVRQ